MYVSPCGWFCIEEPSNWNLKEHKDAILFTSHFDNAQIKITSARKNSIIDEHEILLIHERWLGETGYIEQESTLESYTPEVYSYRTIAGDAQRIRILQHIFWSHYLVLFELSAPIDDLLQKNISDYQELVDTIEPLTID
jgi:hypothetical protein